MKNNEGNIMKKLSEIASSQWLEPYHIKKISNQLASGEIKKTMILQNLPLRPKIGEFFILKKTQKFWKRDGYQYKPRSNGRGFKELSQRIGKNKSIVCLYSQIKKSDEIYSNFWTKGTNNCISSQISPDLYLKDPENEYLQRRIYVDLEGDKDIAVVQYFLKKRFMNEKFDSFRKEGSTRIQSFFDEYDFPF